QQMDEARAAMDKAFGEASEKALNEATGRFLELAKGQFEGEQTRAKERAQTEQTAIKDLLEPMHKELEALEKLTHETGKQNAERMGELRGQIESITKTSESLANALKKPQVRGSWGEGQLIAILESSGWTRGQNFEVQDSTEADGKTLRTDVVITLPRGRKIVIDSKAPLDAYLAANEATSEEERARRCIDHARAVRGHVKSLAGKDYTARYPGSPPYVILFLPYESAYQIACEHDKNLLNDAHKSRIILANPMTLMNLIHLATYVLNEERMQQNAEQVRAHAKELCDRLGKAVEIIGKHGRHLRIAADSYNDLVGSVSGRLLPSANRMREMGAGTEKPLTAPETVDVAIRHMVVPDDPAPMSLPGLT
ncbi:DNA recombination protein RmuC, partial [bacterium]